MKTMVERTRLLVGEEGVKALSSSHVLVVGLGGVGGYAAEALCRAGVGKLTLVDGDVVNTSNRNRQIIALNSTEGKLKAEMWKQRLLDINPQCEIIIIKEFIHADEMSRLLEMVSDCNYVIDAIDTLTPKLQLIVQSLSKGLPIVSSMGSGGKYDPTRVRVADISQTKICSLARSLRKQLHRLGVYEGFLAVYSEEAVQPTSVMEDMGTNKRSTVGTISYLPTAFGCACASVVLRSLLGETITS